MTTIFGLDLSHYQTVPSGARVVSEGFSFMTHKAGGDAADPHLAAWWKAMKPQRDKVLLGAYWVLYPGNPGGRADAFLARLDSQCPGWRDGPFILQLDCEQWNGDPTTKPGRVDIEAACARLESKMPKLMPIVYASAGQYGGSLTGLGYPLWNARYPSGASTTASGIYSLIGGDGGKGWDAYSGKVPVIWQFTDRATAVGQPCDANAFRGTLEQLTALLAPGWSTDMDLTPANLAAFGDVVDARLRAWSEEDPLSTTDPKGTGRIGGWIRNIESRANYRQSVLLAAIGAIAPATVDAGAIAAAVVAALPADEAEKTAQAIIDLVATARTPDQA